MKNKEKHANQKLTQSQTNLFNDFPTIEDAMFKNKQANRNHKRKKRLQAKFK